MKLCHFCQPVVLLILFVPLLLVAQKPEAVTPLEPFIVTGIRPLAKIAEHPLIEPRFGAAVVADGNYLYIIGGSNSSGDGNNGGTRLDSIERVDLRTGQTIPWAKLHVARRHHRAVVAAGKIYVLGGTSGASDPNAPLTEELPEYYGEDLPTGIAYISFAAPSPLRPPSSLGKLPGYLHEATMEIIDLPTGRVTMGPEMPVAKSLFGCVVVDGRILVIGGQRRRGDAISSTNTTEVFDLATGSWSKGINMPTPRRCTATLVDDFVVVLGGYGGTRRLRTVEVYNPREKIWRRLPDLAEPANPSATVWTGPYLFLFGEENARTRQLVYDLRHKQLVTYPLELPNTNFAAATLHQGSIYVVGGADLRSRTESAGIQIFKPSAQPEQLHPASATVR